MWKKIKNWVSEYTKPDTIYMLEGDLFILTFPVPFDMLLFDDYFTPSHSPRHPYTYQAIRQTPWGTWETESHWVSLNSPLTEIWKG